MKKFFVIAAVAALFCLTSCNKDEMKCWEVTVTVTMGSALNSSITGYVWDSENHIEVYIEDLKNKVKASGAEAAGVTVETTYKKAKSHKNQVDCEAQNPEEWGTLLQ